MTNPYFKKIQINRTNFELTSLRSFFPLSALCGAPTTCRGSRRGGTWTSTLKWSDHWSSLGAESRRTCSTTAQITEVSSDIARAFAPTRWPCEGKRTGEVAAAWAAAASSSREPFVGFGLESLRKKILQGLLRALLQLASRRSWRTCTVRIISAWGISCMRRQIITALLAPLPPSTFQLWSQISQTVRGLGWIQSCMLVACMTAEMMKLEGTSVLAPTNLMFVVTPISLVGALKVSIIILHLAPVVCSPRVWVDFYNITRNFMVLKKNTLRYLNFTLKFLVSRDT